MMRELGVPLLIGVAAGLIVAFIPDAPEQGGTPAVVAEPDRDVRFLFDGPRMDAPRGDVLVLADPLRPDSVVWPGPCEDDPLTGSPACAPESQATIQWHNDRIGTVPIADATIHCIRAPCPQPAAPWLIRPAQDTLRFDPANHTVRLSLYAFNADGELLASNAPAASLDRFELYADYIPLSNVRWSFSGNTSGAQTLPFGADVAAAALRGLPVGAVATVHVVDHPYDWLVGELWLTGRIDAIEG